MTLVEEEKKSDDGISGIGGVVTSVKRLINDWPTTTCI
jgi:hypothetical protein